MGSQRVGHDWSDWAVSIHLSTQHSTFSLYLGIYYASIHSYLISHTHTHQLPKENSLSLSISSAGKCPRKDFCKTWRVIVTFWPKQRGTRNTRSHLRLPEGPSELKGLCNLGGHEERRVHLPVRRNAPIWRPRAEKNQAGVLLFVSPTLFQPCLTLCDPRGCSPPGSSVHGDSPGKNPGVGSHALLQGIFHGMWTAGSHLGIKLWFAGLLPTPRLPWGKWLLNLFMRKQ